MFYKPLGISFRLDIIEPKIISIGVVSKENGHLKLTNALLSKDACVSLVLVLGENHLGKGVFSSLVSRGILPTIGD